MQSSCVDLFWWRVAINKNIYDDTKETRKKTCVRFVSWRSNKETQAKFASQTKIKKKGKKKGIFH